MNLKIATCIFALYTITLHISALSWQEIKSSELYYYGEGWGTSIAEADKNALGDLISKIAIDVTEVTSNDINTQNINGNIDEISQFSSSVNTYSRATLTKSIPQVQKQEIEKYSEVEPIITKSTFVEFHDVITMFRHIANLVLVCV